MQRDEGAQVSAQEVLTAQKLEKELQEAEEKLKKAEALIAAVAKELGERPPEKGTRKERA